MKKFFKAVGSVCAAGVMGAMTLGMGVGFLPSRLCSFPSIAPTGCCAL